MVGMIAATTPEWSRYGLGYYSTPASQCAQEGLLLRLQVPAGELRLLGTSKLKS